MFGAFYFGGTFFGDVPNLVVIIPTFGAYQAMRVVPIRKVTITAY